MSGEVTIFAIATELAPEAFKDGVVALLSKWWEKKQRRAFEILMEDVRAGRIDIVDASVQDDIAHAIWKYFLAARDGAAQKNLRFIARALVGMLSERKLFADDFDKYTV